MTWKLASENNYAGKILKVRVPQPICQTGGEPPKQKLTEAKLTESLTRRGRHEVDRDDRTA